MLGIMQGRLSPQRSDLIQEFPWETWEEEFPLASALGLNCIEWTVDRSNLAKNPIFLESNQNRIENLASEYNLKISTVTLDNFIAAPIHKINLMTKLRSGKNEIEWLLKKLSKTKIKYLVLPIVAESGNESNDSLQSLVESLNWLNQVIQPLNLFIALELELKLNQIEHISNQISNLPNIGFNFDIGNSASLGNDPKYEIFLYGEKLFNVHIKDRRFAGTTVPLGEGVAEFEIVFESLDALNYSGNYVLQAARIQNQSESKTIEQYIRFCRQNGLKNI